MFETLQARSLAGILSLTLAIALAIGASRLVRALQDYACMQSSHHRERTLPE